MTFFIVLFTVVLVLDCLLLSLLILVQLPKKEAGIGMAFGSGATDALFGAGSGTALSNLTKYTAAAFFILVFSLCILKNHSRHQSVSELKRQFEHLPAPQAPASQSAPASDTAPAASNPAVMPLTISTNIIPATSTPATNAPAVPAK